MNSRLFAIRGATCAENTEESIVAATTKMCREIFEKNNLHPASIVSIHFTLTSDLDALNPATALRLNLKEFSSCPLFCSQEASVKGMLPKTIRVLVSAYFEEGTEIRHIYINGAERLRPDIANV